MEKLELRYCIRFSQRFSDIQVETIRKIQQALSPITISLSLILSPPLSPISHCHSSLLLSTSLSRSSCSAARLSSGGRDSNADSSPEVETGELMEKFQCLIVTLQYKIRRRGIRNMAHPQCWIQARALGTAAHWSRPAGEPREEIF